MLNWLFLSTTCDTQCTMYNIVLTMENIKCGKSATGKFSEKLAMIAVKLVWIIYKFN